MSDACPTFDLLAFGSLGDFTVILAGAAVTSASPAMARSSPGGGRAWARQRVTVAVVAGSVQLSTDGNVIPCPPHPPRPDAQRCFGETCRTSLRGDAQLTRTTEHDAEHDHCDEGRRPPMFVTVIHRIHDPKGFQEAEAKALEAGLPTSVALPVHAATRDHRLGICIWEGESVAAVREVVEGAVGRFADNEYSEMQVDGLTPQLRN
jgi:hypothetical protein